MIGRPRRNHGGAASRRTLPRRQWAALAAALATVPAIAEPATAEVQPTLQARVANAEFLAYAPPPPKPAAVCLIDSGVDLNPDTAPLIAERISLDGGSGDDVLPSKHGTQMAMVMGAPANGWGMVGIWPYLKIVSVRATPAGQEGFEFGAYGVGLEECRLRAADTGSKAAELALGGAKGSDDRMRKRSSRWFAQARLLGLSVVAAGGNSGGAVEAPASFGPVFAVAAADATGALCAFAPVVPAIDIAAPGCALDQACGGWRCAHSGRVEPSLGDCGVDCSPHCARTRLHSGPAGCGTSRAVGNPARRPGARWLMPFRRSDRDAES